MKFKTKEEIIKEYEEGNMSDKDVQKSYVFGVIDTFKSFKERIDFYEKYKDCNFPLAELKHIMPEDVQTQYKMHNEQCVNDWLFKYCFGGI